MGSQGRSVQSQTPGTRNFTFNGVVRMQLAYNSVQPEIFEKDHALLVSLLTNVYK